MAFLSAFGRGPAFAEGIEQTPADRAAAHLLQCLGCHRLDGAGVPPEVPSLLGLIGAILATAAGRDYIARVPEVAQSPRDDAALTRLLDRVLQESSAETLPVGSRAPGPAEVGAARTGVLADPLRTRAAIAGQTAPHGDSAQ